MKPSSERPLPNRSAGTSAGSSASVERPAPRPTPDGVARLQAAYRQHLNYELSAEDAGQVLEQMMRFFIIQIDNELEKHELESEPSFLPNTSSGGE